MKKVRSYLFHKIIFPSKTFFWKWIHPKTIKREGILFNIQPEIVPYYIYSKNTFSRLLPIFNQHVNSKSIVVDVGASFGFYSLYCAKHLQAQKVIAIEPTSKSFELLNKNIKDNQTTNIEPIRTAIGDTKGEVALYLDKTCFGNNSLSIKTDQSEMVSLNKLDDIIPHADFIKIDTEGFEYKVIQGMTRLLKESRPVLLLELGQDAAPINLLLQEQEYVATTKIGHNQLFLPKEKLT
ncbi:FkbM family methyltransferase [Candidatus Woesearchaeota archaeon]|nr:FkbM family methyltransferase [Candidatus Woesearchaeota archaeon]